MEEMIVMNNNDPLGYQWEKSVFGLSANESKGKFQPMSRIAGTMKVMREQGRLNWNPEHPPTTTGREIMACVASYLSPEDSVLLKMYCSIGTVLDFQHNIDGFFKLGSNVLPIDLKAGSPPPGYTNGSFLLMMRECNGFRMWRQCRDMARLLQNGSGVIYKVN